MDKNIRMAFDKIFIEKVNKEFCYIKKDEFIDYFKNIVDSLKNNNFCFSFETNTDEEEYQFTGKLKDICVNNHEIKILGDFKQTCNEENKKDTLLFPIDKIDKGFNVKLVFNPSPWIASVLKQDLPETTNIIFQEVISIEDSDEQYYKQYHLTFYFNLKEMFSELIQDKNIARRIEFTAEEDVINFFTDIKEDLIGKTFHYWVGENVSTPILDIDITKEDGGNIIKIITEYGEEDVHAEYVQGIQESDNFLHFNQRNWDGSEYKVRL